MMKHKSSGRPMITSSAASVVALLVLWAGLTPTLRGQEEEASPAAEHLAIAARYRQEAAEMREAIKRHQIAIDVYRRGTERPYTVMNPQGRERMIQHCERVIAYYTEAAKELDAMATEHAALAQQSLSPEHRERQS